MAWLAPSPYGARADPATDPARPVGTMDLRSVLPISCSKTDDDAVWRLFCRAAGGRSGEGSVTLGLVLSGLVCKVNVAREFALRVLHPLASWLRGLQHRKRQRIIVGIVGGPGAGKATLAACFWRPDVSACGQGYRSLPTSVELFV